MVRGQQGRTQNRGYWWERIRTEELSHTQPSPFVPLPQLPLNYLFLLRIPFFLLSNPSLSILWCKTGSAGMRVIEVPGITVPVVIKRYSLPWGYDMPVQWEHIWRKLQDARFTRRVNKYIPSTTSLPLIKSSNTVNVSTIHSSKHSWKPVQLETPPISLLWCPQQKGSSPSSPPAETCAAHAFTFIPGPVNILSLELALCLTHPSASRAYDTSPCTSWMFSCPMFMELKTRYILSATVLGILMVIVPGKLLLVP